MLGNELVKRKKSGQQDDGQLSIVRSPEVFPIAKFVQKNSWKSPLYAAGEQPDHFYGEAMRMNHYHAHKFITKELRERLHRKEQARIGKKHLLPLILWHQDNYELQDESVA